MSVYNNTYSPSCATDCDDQLLAEVGNTNCPSSATLEIAEINILHLDERDGATAGSPKTPIAAVDPLTITEAEILTWRGLHDNVTASKVRTLVGVGEKPEGSSTEVELHKGIKHTLENREQLVYTISIIDDATYLALRTLQACKGKYHAWFATDSFLYGGQNGMIVDVEKVSFTKTGGRSSVSTCTITLGWSADAEPVRNPLPYEVV